MEAHETRQSGGGETQEKPGTHSEAADNTSCNQRTDILSHGHDDTPDHPDPAGQDLLRPSGELNRSCSEILNTAKRTRTTCTRERPKR